MNNFNKEPEIIWVDWGVGNVFADGTMEIHKDLAQSRYSRLRRKVIQHELRHDYSKGKMHNLAVDMKPGVSSWALFKFMVSRPKTWIQALPFYYHPKRKIIVYDKNLLFFWTIIAIAIVIIS